MKVNDRYCSFYYELDEDYGEIVIDGSRTALLIVDMQYHFLTRPDTSGMSEREKAYYARWEYFYDRVDNEVIPNNARLLSAFRERKMLVAHARITGQLANGRDRSLDQKATGYNELLLLDGNPAGEIVAPLAPRDDGQRPYGNVAPADAAQLRHRYGGRDRGPDRSVRVGDRSQLGRRELQGLARRGRLRGIDA